MNKTKTCVKCGKVTRITMKGQTKCSACGTPFSLSKNTGDNTKNSK